jgi:hypothetical protein
MSELSSRGARSLRDFFEQLVWRRFVEHVHLEESSVTQYVSDMLGAFVHVDNLYRIRNVRGRRLEEVGEMLMASNPLLMATSFDREREVRKHIGDYTLFMTGLFPESIVKASRAELAHLDAFVDLVQAGKESYSIVSSFDQFEYRDEVPLFRKLTDNFELCVFGLNLVKQDLEEFQRDYYRHLKQNLDEDSINPE